MGDHQDPPIDFTSRDARRLFWRAMQEGEKGKRDAWGCRAAYVRKYGQNWSAKAMKNALPTREKHDAALREELEKEEWDEEAELTKYASGLSGLNKPAAKGASPTPAARSTIASSSSGGAGSLAYSPAASSDTPPPSGTTNLLGLAVAKLSSIAKSLEVLPDIKNTLAAMHDDRRHQLEREKSVYKSALKIIQKDKGVAKGKGVAKKIAVEIKDSESDESEEEDFDEEEEDGNASEGSGADDALKSFNTEKEVAKKTAAKNDEKKNKKRKSSSDIPEKGKEDTAAKKKAPPKKAAKKGEGDSDEDAASAASGPARAGGLGRPVKPPRSKEVQG